jgi:uncharacterized protein (DUF1015 family)
MADIAPLTPLRYDLTKLAKGLADVVAPPYDVISPEERTALANRHSHNIVKLILPEGEGDSKYENAKKIIESWKADGVLVRDSEPAFYRYDQSFVPPGGTEKKSRRGFLAAVKLVPLSDRIVLPHERTLSGPKEDRLKLFRATRTNLSPGFMLYRDAKRALDSALNTATPLTEFTTDDGVSHALAKVTDKEAIAAIVAGVAASTLLIADGHHRYETAVRYGSEITDSLGANASPHAEHKYFMTFLANGDDPGLLVFPTHRFVHSLPSFSFDELVKKAGALFHITPLGKSFDAKTATTQLEEAKALGVSFIACAPNGEGVLLTLKKEADLAGHPLLGQVNAALRVTDVAVLHMGILESILGISKEAQAAKTNIWYPQNANESITELRAGKGQVLFLMNGTPVKDVRNVAEAGEVMPQKSTFFYPKVVTGLAVHTLDPSRSVAG